MALTLPEIKAYLGTAAERWTDEQITDAWNVEWVHQDEVISGSSPALDGALLRRIQRSLEIRGMTGGGVGFDPETGAPAFGRNDPEVRRLEAPFRKVILG